MRALLVPTAAYVLSRLVNLVAVALAARWSGHSFRREVGRWDSAWFLRLAVHGYPHHLHYVHGQVTSSTLAFFPLFPLTVRSLADVTGQAPLVAGLAASLLSGLTATWGVWALVRHYAGARTADRAAAAFAFFPGSFVFGMIYSDGLVLTLVSFALLMLLQRRWLLAGGLGALATASAPGALMLLPAAGWAALASLRRGGGWRALLAPLLTPAGFLAYQAWIYLWTGHLNAWTLTERGGWHSYLLLRYPYVVAQHFVASPFAHLKITVIFLGAVFSLIGLGLMARHRPPAVVAIFALASIALVVVTTPLGARPRMILWAFPLVTVWASVLGRRLFAAFIAASAVGLAALTVFSLTSWVLIP